MTHHEIANWKQDTTVRRIVNATFPSYRKRKVWVRASESVSIYNLNWDGGSRNEYRACSIEGRAGGSLDRFKDYAPWDPRQIHNQSVPLLPGAVVVQGGTFCGKDATLTIHVHPSDMPRYLAHTNAVAV